MAKKKKEKIFTEKKKVMELLYMTTSEIKAVNIKEAVGQLGDITVEIWEDLNVVQLVLHNTDTVDFEPMELDFNEDSDKAFVKNRDIKTIFYVTVDEEDFDQIKSVFRGIIEKLGGFFCTDSNDFRPIYKEEDL